MSSGQQGKEGRTKSANQNSESGQRLDDDMGREILSTYQENKLGSVNNLVDESHIKKVQQISCKKYIIQILNYEDEDGLHEMPAQEAYQGIIEAQYADVTATNRGEIVPQEFEEGHIDFPRPDTERVGSCTDCGGNGRNRCTRCNGSGRNNCSSCNGSGTNYDNTKSCSSCGGSGSKACKKCDGTGSIACSTCETTGQTWKMDFVRRKFTPEEKIEADAPDVPSQFVKDAEGEYVKTEEADPQENEIRREVEERDIDVEKVEYVYDNEDYELYRIEGNVKSESYPMNQARKWAPYVGALVIVLVGLWYFGVI